MVNEVGFRPLNYAYTLSSRQIDWPSHQLEPRYTMPQTNTPSPASLSVRTSLEVLLIYEIVSQAGKFIQDLSAYGW